MLSRLHIRNYAIIDDLSVDFHPGFNIITGETGAGKSILMGALGLVLGDRADTAVLFSPTDKCIVEATFQPVDTAALHSLLKACDLDEDDVLVVRREISNAGKSRSFINDTPVTLQVLRMFANQMVDLHRQFETQDLGDDDFQRNVLDALAGNGALMEQYHHHFSAYSKAQSQLQHLLKEQINAQKELDYFSFLYHELEEANFSENEIEEAENEFNLLSNAESIKQVLSEAVHTLNAGDAPVTSQLKLVWQQMQQLRSKPDGLDDLLERLQSALIELKDISGELDSMNDSISMNAERIQLLSERINLGNRLLKKHAVQTTNELLGIQADLHQKLQSVVGLDAAIEKLRNESELLLQQTLVAGRQISKKRKAAIPSFEKNVKQLLTQVGMPNASLKVECSDLKDPANHGLDEVVFLFDANKSGRFELLEKVASGGELSRLMLVVKSLVAGSLQMPTLIFDEIDTGISGEAARQVGIIMKQMSNRHQLIAITHQPQIAARAEAHYYVFKQERAGAIKTGIRLLLLDERVDAIARMLSGEQLSEASIRIAREMVGAGE